MGKKTIKPDESMDSIEETQTKKITEDMIRFVRENAKTMTYGEMAAELGLTSPALITGPSFSDIL